MAIIFSEADLKDIKPPCVLQSFINHNAVLYKVFVVGEAYSVVERPSIRNLPSGPTGQSRVLDGSALPTCACPHPLCAVLIQLVFNCSVFMLYLVCFIPNNLTVVKALKWDNLWWLIA